MAIIRKPVKGSKDAFHRDTQVWSQIIDTVNYVQGRLADPNSSDIADFQVFGVAHKSLEVGSCVALEPTGTGMDYAGEIISNVSTNMVDVEWHSNIGQVVLVQEPASSENEAVNIITGQFCRAATSNAVGPTISAGKRYAMPDPEDPSKLKISASGMFEVVYMAGANHAIVNIYRNQPYWMYELSSSFEDGEATARLIDIDDEEFEVGSNTTITDHLGLMSDQGVGDKGICLHAGNKFHAIQAACT